MIRKTKNKKAQVYIFTAVLLAGLVLGIIALNWNNVFRKDNFEQITDNYGDELYYVMNNAVYEDKNIVEEVDKFTGNFKAYALERNLNLEVAAVVYDGDEISIVNHFTQPIIAETSGDELTIAAGRVNSTAKRDEINIIALGVTYNFDLGIHGVKGIIRHGLGNNVQVRLIN